MTLVRPWYEWMPDINLIRLSLTNTKDISAQTDGEIVEDLSGRDPKRS